MTRHTYHQFTAAIFAIIALLHLFRVFYGWPAVVGAWTTPMWVSWAALLISGYLAWAGFRLSRA
ncbi:MAG: hypothetical protein HYZ11_01330 [Candidatus Tectomicrobia bacterium]|uniref:Uncharacterized protein n=1 Tax=Tectimicrobiota bacterium TaxID=2528274 RepID=A0A932HYL5_UNCTE|nr:hypothetical protein [Candidatus Tectomicrobia bacterium]